MLLLVSDGYNRLDGLSPKYFGNLVEVNPRRFGVSKRSRFLKLIGRPWAADNGAFTGFDQRKFLILLERVSGIPGCLFTVAPDVVGDMELTLKNFEMWEPVIKFFNLPVGLALQDGLTKETPIPWNKLDAVFIGGTTKFKYSTIVRETVLEALIRSKWTHCGRVNTIKRFRYMKSIGVKSVDGSSFSRWSSRLKWIEPILMENTI